MWLYGACLYTPTSASHNPTIRVAEGLHTTDQIYIMCLLCFWLHCPSCICQRKSQKESGWAGGKAG